MIYDLLEEFNKIYDEYGDKVILDNYNLKDGLYIKITKNGDIDLFYKTHSKIKEEGKTKTVHTFTNKEGTKDEKMHEWFQYRDYYSNVIETGKSFDAPKKSIHNNNYLTLFMKNEPFLQLDFDHLQKNLYKKTLSFKSFNAKSEKKILQPYCPYIKSFSRKKAIAIISRWMRDSLPRLQEIAASYNPKEYVKIFFDRNFETYKQEAGIYLALKVYNDNKYSIHADGQTYGLSNFNMGLNSKKPFLSHKNRKKGEPFFINDTDVLQLKKFEDWLSLQGRYKHYLGNSFVNTFSKNDEIIIDDFDNLPIKKFILHKPIYVYNLLRLPNEEDYEISSLQQLEKTVDDLFYNKQLQYNYFNDSITVSSFLSKTMQELLYETKTAMINFFKKFDARSFYQIIEKSGNDFVAEQLRQGNSYKAALAMNLKLSLQHNKGANIMDIQAMQENTYKKIARSDYTPLNLEQFSYLSGQIVRYLLNKSKAGKKDADMMEPFLRTKKSSKLKEEIQFLFFKYKHEIGLNFTTFNNAMSLISAYEKEQKIDKDAFLIGVLSQNILYTKAKEDTDE